MHDCASRWGAGRAADGDKSSHADLHTRGMRRNRRQMPAPHLGGTNEKAHHLRSRGRDKLRLERFLDPRPLLRGWWGNHAWDPLSLRWCNDDNR